MTVEVFHCSGVPGSGKTRFLTEQCRRWGSEVGFGHILIASYTRAAAAEIVGRNLPLRKDQVGTLHSFAFRALDLSTDDVAESHLDEFNDAFPGYKLSGEVLDADEQPVNARSGATDADVSLARVEIMRSQMVPVSEWTANDRNFYERWAQWCRDCGYVDFTAMIEMALDGAPVAPGNPAVALFDEQQDSSKLESLLIQRWSQHMEKVLLAYDADQALYGFRGADPDGLVALSEHLDDEHKRYLTQSYRLPEKINTVAQGWISRLAHREPKVSLPRHDEDGTVAQGLVRRLGGASWKAPVALVNDIVAQIEAKRTVLVLGSCNYMLSPLMKELRVQAVPFSELGRASKRSSWAPPGTSRRTAATDRILAYLRPQESVWGDESRWYTWADVADWAEPLRGEGLFKHGAKAKLKRMVPSIEAPYWDLAEQFLDLDAEERERIDAGDLSFFEEHLLPARRSAYEFPLHVAAKRGGATLREEPLVRVGSIHASKGRQAQCVYIFPDLSMTGHNEWSLGGARREAVVRQFYVALTRASEELVLPEEATPYYLSREMLLRPVSA